MGENNMKIYMPERFEDFDKESYDKNSHYAYHEYDEDRQKWRTRFIFVHDDSFSRTKTLEEIVTYLDTGYYYEGHENPVDVSWFDFTIYPLSIEEDGGVNVFLLDIFCDYPLQYDFDDEYPSIEGAYPFSSFDDVSYYSIMTSAFNLYSLENMSEKDKEIYSSQFKENVK
jgi:hypothetical protein